MMDDHGHTPVLARQVMELLAPRRGEVAVDCTVGRGGHARLLGEAVGAGGRVVGFDLDGPSLAHAERRLAGGAAAFTAVHDSFVTVAAHMVELGLRADVVLADLGFSSAQMDDAERGFSFRHEGPLDMRFDRASGPSAADLLADLEQRELAEIIGRFGEEPLAGKIARKLAQSRRGKPIQTTAELARLVVEAYGSRARTSRLHPATRTFMALRIAVNDELGALEGLLAAITGGAERIEEGGWLRPHARVAIISFHSLEDRLVKQAFARLGQRSGATLLTKRPVTADAQEVHGNARSRSAKLRAVRMHGPAIG